MNTKAKKTFLSLEPKKSGKVLHLPNLQRDFRQARKRVDIERLRVHDLRSTFATRLVEKGCDIVTLKELLGHADISTTMRYAHSRSHEAAVKLLDVTEPSRSDRSASEVT